MAPGAVGKEGPGSAFSPLESKTNCFSTGAHTSLMPAELYPETLVSFLPEKTIPGRGRQGARDCFSPHIPLIPFWPPTPSIPESPGAALLRISSPPLSR